MRCARAQAGSGVSNLLTETVPSCSSAINNSKLIMFNDLKYDHSFVARTSFPIRVSSQSGRPLNIGSSRAEGRHRRDIYKSYLKRRQM
ncbi:hypothetical protein EVAR_86229_1 [Eumeta japonica]|uniref:Uncharacterized protein n=1 Tax=Eumeta variegata TaxID=151549 RepID=A0A4C1UD11_EUMVA|nr:hypothetical protein EVAR_86229_1 [Eumeta japonica]